MALDFDVELTLTTPRQKYEQTLIMALDVYMSHVGTTPYANAIKSQHEILRKMDEEFPDTVEGRRLAMNRAMKDLGKFMQEVALYMGVVGAMRTLLSDAIVKHEYTAIETWLRLESDELKAIGYELTYHVEEKLVLYKLVFAKSKVEIDTGAVPNPLYGR